MKRLKLISALMFTLILISFLFPFIAIEFGYIHTVTGFGIVTAETSILDISNFAQGRVIYAFTLALIGLGASFFNSRNKYNHRF